MTSIFRARIVLPSALLLCLAGAAFAAGGATITLNDFPEYVAAGAPLKLTFTIRQDGQTLIAGLHPAVNATTSRGLSAKSSVTAGKNQGEYTTTINLPEPGEWMIKIASDPNDSVLTLPALKVIAAGTTPPAPFSPNTRGVRLFATKGCVGCHRHLEVNPEHATDPKLDLTGKRFPQDYLRNFLADPSIKTKDMPSVALKNDEIEALAAFINKLMTKAAGGGVR